MTCSDLLVLIIEAGPRGLARVHIKDLEALNHLQELKLVSSNDHPYWLDSRVYLLAERTGNYGAIENIASWRGK